MQFARYLLILMIALAALGGCASNPLTEVKRVFQGEGKQQLDAGIKYYEDGRYSQASTNLQNALNSGLRESDQVTAHKYLAFIHCGAGRERQCRAHFRTALEINPSFELQPAEAGHPTWGPIFRQVKAGRR